MSTPTDPTIRRHEFVENFAQMWSRAGSKVMDGRVLGYLLIMNEEYISSTDLAKALRASTGSISVSSRNLVESGIIRRHWIPGDRRHYFAVDIDPWGQYLAAELPGQVGIQRALQSASDLVPDLAGDSKERIRNAIDYFEWMDSRRQSLWAEWEEYKKQRDSHPDSSSC